MDRMIDRNTNSEENRWEYRIIFTFDPFALAPEVVASGG